MSYLADSGLLRSPVQYIVEVTDNGPDPAASVIITDTMSVGISIIIMCVTKRSCRIDYPVQASQLGTPSPGVIMDMVIRMVSQSTETFNNFVVVDSATADPNPVKNLDSEETTIPVFEIYLSALPGET